MKGVSGTRPHALVAVCLLAYLTLAIGGRALVVCIGGDGHAAIELPHAAGCCAATADSRADTAWTAAADACVDAPLAIPAEKTDAPTRMTPPTAVAFAALAPDAPAAPPAAAVAAADLARLRQPPLHLRALATFVLLV